MLEKNTEKIIIDNKNVKSVIVKLKVVNKTKKSIRGGVGGFGREYAGGSCCRLSWAGRSRVDGGADQDVG